jgi:MoxR-like ATPase
MALSKSMAQLRGRDYVLPEDIQEAFHRCIAHRVLLSPAAQAQDQSAEDVLRAIVSAVAPPKLR